MNNHLNKAFLVCVFFLLVFTLTPTNWHYVADFEFHFLKSQGCENSNDKEACEVYFPLLHFFGSVFAFSKQAFARFLMFLLVFITPLILYYITRKWIVTWFFFATTQYVYILEGGGAYPQALAGILLLLLLSTKNNYFRAGILLVSILAHSQAFFLVGVSWLILLFFENFKGKSFFPACSALWGVQDVDPIGEKVQLQLVGLKGIAQVGVQIKNVGNFFLRTFPFPFLLASFWQLFKEKQFAPIALTLLFFYLGVAITPRIFTMIPLVLLPSMTRFYYGLNGWMKYGFLGLTVMSFVWQMGTWVLFKVNCVAF